MKDLTSSSSHTFLTDLEIILSIMWSLSVTLRIDCALSSTVIETDTEINTTHIFTTKKCPCREDREKTNKFDIGSGNPEFSYF
jgi:hypothetical protein